MSRRRHAFVVLACVAGLSFVPALSSAGEKPSAADVTSAYKHLSAGQKLLAQKKYADARSELEASFALDPQPVALKGIGEALIGEHRLIDAYDTLQRALTQPGRPLLPYQKKEVDTEIADLTARTATIAIAVDQAGATIAIDGVARGVSPTPSPVRLEVGEHKISVTKPGFVSFDALVKLTGGMSKILVANLVAEVQSANTVDVVIREKTGRVVEVVIDGLSVGTTPFHASFAPGSYEVALVDDGTIGAPTLMSVQTSAIDLELEAPKKAVVLTLECATEDDCDDGERCDAGKCKAKPKKPRWAEEGQSCDVLPCVGNQGLVCSEHVCRKREDLPFSLRRGLSASWSVGAGLGGEAQWFVPMHAIGFSMEFPIGRWVRYHVSLGPAFENGFTGFHLSPLGFGVPIPIGPADPHDLQLYIEPGIDAFRGYGFRGSESLDFVFSYALWGRLVAVRRELFAFLTPIELERPFHRLAGNSSTLLSFGTSGTNYMVSLGVGLVL